jgi:cell division protein FtsB
VRILIPRRKPKKLVSRRSSRRAGQTALIIVVISVLGSLYALVGDSGLLAVMKMRARANQLRYEIVALERENQELLETIKPLRDGDPDAIERLAREKLFMVRPGDTLYMLPPEPLPAPPAQTESASPTGPSLPRRR